MKLDEAKKHVAIGPPLWLFPKPFPIYDQKRPCFGLRHFFRQLNIHHVQSYPPLYHQKFYLTIMPLSPFIVHTRLHVFFYSP